MEEELFNRIRNYDLIQVNDWTDLEEFLFKSVASWFAEWMARYTGAPNMAISTLPANEVKSAVEKIEKKLPDSAASKVEEKGENFKDGKLWSNKITNNVPHFTINNFKDYITTIYRIGMEQKAESQPYVIE